MAHSIRKVGVIGAGQMGSGIAHVCALAGLDVRLNDISADRIRNGIATIKPTQGRIPAFNPSAPVERPLMAQFMSSQGPLARSVAVRI